MSNFKNSYLLSEYQKVENHCYKAKNIYLTFFLSFWKLLEREVEPDVVVVLLDRNVSAERVHFTTLMLLAKIQF